MRQAIQAWKWPPQACAVRADGAAVADSEPGALEQLSSAEDKCALFQIRHLLSKSVRQAACLSIQVATRCCFFFDSWIAFPAAHFHVCVRSIQQPWRSRLLVRPTAHKNRRRPQAYLPLTPLFSLIQFILVSCRTTHVVF